MKKSKLIPRMTIAAILMLLIFSYTGSVQGAKTERIRPIDDWIYGNDSDSWNSTDYYSIYYWPQWDDWDRSITMTGNPGVWWRGNGFYKDDGSGALYVIHYDWTALNEEVQYEGFIIEKELADGSLYYKVNIHVKGLYVEIYETETEWAQPLWMYITELAFIGKMDFTFHFEFILEKVIPGGYMPWLDITVEPGIREPGAELPPLWAMLYAPNFYGAYDTSYKLVGIGTAEAVEPGWLPPFSPVIPDQPEFWWFLPPENEIPEGEDPVLTGETVNVKLHTIDVYKPQFNPGHPYYNPYYGYFYPPIQEFKIY